MAHWGQGAKWGRNVHWGQIATATPKSASETAGIASVEALLTTFATLASDSTLVSATDFSSLASFQILTTNDTAPLTAVEGAGAAIQAPPVISSVVASRLSNTSMLITWQTDRPATSQVEYGTTSVYGSLTPLDSTPVMAHSVIVSGLLPGTTYHYRVRSDG